MKSCIIALAFGVGLPVLAFAQEAPTSLEATEPQAAVGPAWQEYMAVFNPKGASDGKTKELIALAVAAQIPCDYCVYGHTVGAKHAGATDEQIKEAVAAAALVRKMSTQFLSRNGIFGEMALIDDSPRSATVIRGEHELFGFLTTDANAIVAPIHPKAMPVILTTASDVDQWLQADTADTLALQRPLPDDALRIVAKGEKEDRSPEFAP
jgi:AhpD family alkylhydroperoxidase